MANPRILILGCGWLGQVLANTYSTLGYTVFATTTQQEKYHRLLADGIFAILADFDQAVSVADFPTEVDYVINSIPATKRNDEQVVATRFANVLELLKQIRFQKQVFFSSIGVYPDRDGTFTEDYNLEKDASNLLLAEQLMMEQPNTLIYRLGGLFGDQRIFAKYFQGKICRTGNQLANFIHQTDVVQLVVAGLSSKLTTGTFNIVSPENPLKKEVIRASAKRYEMELPSAFELGDDFQKCVPGTKIKLLLNYTYLYPSPLDF